jgi:hypothetical protein
MSKSYQYFAKKRNSRNYFAATTSCNYNKSHNYITCITCLRKAGRTRCIQQYNSK